MKLMTLDIRGTLAECPSEDCTRRREDLPYYEMAVSHGFNRAGKTVDACPYCGAPMVKRGFHVPPEAITFNFDDDEVPGSDIPPEPVPSDVEVITPEDVADVGEVIAPPAENGD